MVGTLRLRVLSQSCRILFYLLCLTLLSEIASEICRYVLKNNLMVFHIYNPLHFCLMAIGYNYEIRENKIISTGIGTYILFSILNAIFWQPFFDEYCSYSFDVNVVLVSGLCLYYLYKLLQEETEDEFTEYPLFWTSIAYLIYNSANILGLGAFNKLSENPNLAYMLEQIRAMSNYLLYLMFIIAFMSKQKYLKHNNS